MIEWQINWRVWQWPWHNALEDWYGNYHYWSHFAGFGPLQFRWKSLKSELF